MYTQQPHWHVLFDGADLPSHQINLKLAWDFWRDTWHVGGLNLGSRKAFQSPEQALSCISSYLIKRPESFPEWVLATPSIRFINASKAVGSVVSKTKPKSNAEARPRHASAGTSDLPQKDALEALEAWLT